MQTRASLECRTTIFVRMASFDASANLADPASLQEWSMQLSESLPTRLLQTAELHPGLQAAAEMSSPLSRQPLARLDIQLLMDFQCSHGVPISGYE